MQIFIFVNTLFPPALWHVKPGSKTSFECREEADSNDLELLRDIEPITVLWTFEHPVITIAAAGSDCCVPLTPNLQYEGYKVRSL